MGETMKALIRMMMTDAVATLLECERFHRPMNLWCGMTRDQEQLCPWAALLLNGTH
jgi:hypothetical protein